MTLKLTLNVRFWHFFKNLINFDPPCKKFHNRTDINTHPLSNFLTKNEIPEGCNLCTHDHYRVLSRFKFQVGHSNWITTLVGDQIWILVQQNWICFCKITYRKVVSSNTSCLEAHAGFFRLLMKGIFDQGILTSTYFLCNFFVFNLLTKLWFPN